MRTPIIVGNWKMHKTEEEVLSFVGVIEKENIPHNVESAICAPYVFLPLLIEKLRDRDIRVQVGAQNVYWEDTGAYTGEVSAPMLASLGVQYVIIGHSERRRYFADTNETVNRKLRATLQNDLLPILCVGETMGERGQGKTMQVIGKQVTEALEGVSSEEMKKVVIAYEPVWAIGTGQSATVNDAQEVIAFIRSVVAHLYSSEIAVGVRIQYGGSVTAENIDQFLIQPDIDGALVGGASLDPASFLKMLQAVDNVVGP